MRILIIDNYETGNSPQITHLYQIITNIVEQPIEVMLYSTMTPQTDLSGFNAIILSGSQKLLSEAEIYEEFTNVAEVVRNTTRPVLGVCFGHQLVARIFGSEVISTGITFKGYYVVKTVVADPLFEGLGKEFLVTKSHKEIITALPYDFIQLATSPSVPIEAMRHTNRPLYGIQFHPERYDARHPAGRTILENFIKIAWLY